jgi:[methyl-Co(III) methanol-specific corrinoid protein]:coenzyme M methyltransferase
MIGPDAFRKLIKPNLIKLSNNIEGYSILHICGETDIIVSDMLECGFNAISIEESVKDIDYVVSLAHKNNTAVIGNVSTSRTLYNKNAGDVRKEAFKCLAANIDILAPGCGIAPETPLRNLLALADARNEYYR